MILAFLFFVVLKPCLKRCHGVECQKVEQCSCTCSNRTGEEWVARLGYRVPALTIQSLLA
ncbi:hypothetical protein M758_6G030500 [Ceratodon purpureus]|uniref:Secreted protein n=1 Tax=Ceratodon purpureus TaxID=3225 RepID=A0A8T0HEE3_CERPU|nr:hypothetical protein KC19_6G033400 [Ceratodon purpureus]KAG0612471.1 hypothetical protein M758_6G030500 [Ceratodon purpureus]